MNKYNINIISDSNKDINDIFIKVLLSELKKLNIGDKTC